LLALARDLRHPRRSLFSGFPAPAMARPSSLGRRVSAMLNAQIDRRPITATARAATVVALLLVAIPIAAAQSFATFSGTLIDATGAVLPGVKVVLTNAERRSKYEVQSTGAGTFEFVGLPAGAYELDAQQIGFATLHETLAIAAGQNLQRQLQLNIGSLSETIIVTDEEPDPAAPKKVMAVRGPAPVDAACRPALRPAITVGGNIRPPKKLHDVAPEYPAALRGSGTQGVVILGATIGLDGFLKDIEVLRDAGSQDLAVAAVTAVRDWQYSQTLLNCSPVEVQIKTTVTFRHKEQ
jgi:TonB family protein